MKKGVIPIAVLNEEYNVKIGVSGFRFYYENLIVEYYTNFQSGSVESCGNLIIIALIF